jgi:hypothetical protein
MGARGDILSHGRERRPNESHEPAAARVPWKSKMNAKPSIAAARGRA